jgi:hypothetical protein
MKLKKVDEDGRTVLVDVSWGDHSPGCKKCRRVDLEKSASFVDACAMGSKLIAEEMAKRQAPVVAQKRAEVKKWAREAGFAVDSGLSKDRVKAITKYVE